MPAYEARKRDPGAGLRLGRLVVAGISTRTYAGVVPEMAQSVGRYKSAVSGKLVMAAEAALARLGERQFGSQQILAVFIKGIADRQHITARRCHTGDGIGRHHGKHCIVANPPHLHIGRRYVSIEHDAV